MGFYRLAGVCALGFVALNLTVNISLESGSPPRGDAAPAEVARYFAEHATVVEYGVALTWLTWVLLALFCAGAAVLIGRIERERGEGWSIVGVIGAAMVVSTFCVINGVRLVLSMGDPATETLWHLHSALFPLHVASNILVLVGFSVGGIRTGTIWSWHGVFGLIGAGIMAIGVTIGSFNASAGPAGMSVFGLVGWAMWLTWIAIFGVALLRTRAAVPVRL